MFYIVQYDIEFRNCCEFNWDIFFRLLELIYSINFYKNKFQNNSSIIVNYIQFIKKKHSKVQSLDNIF